MHYFNKPASQRLTNLGNLPDQDWSFDQFLSDLVWHLPIWRQNKDMLEAMRRMRAAFAANKSEDEIALSDADHEKLLAQVKAIDLSQRGAIVDAVSEYTYALMCTRDKPADRAA